MFRPTARVLPLALALFACTTAAPKPDETAATKAPGWVEEPDTDSLVKITLVGTNDLHGWIEPHERATKEGGSPILGGSDVFALAMPRADRLEITRVHMAPEGDVRFPPIDPAQWREVRHEAHKRGPGDDTDFTILTYERAR